MTFDEFKKRYEYDPDNDRLGSGGFGDVFKAYDTHRDRWIALKIAKVLPDYDSVRLKREVDMVAQLPTHPNVAYYEEGYTFDSFDGKYDFGILQYYENGNLLQLMKNGKLTAEQKHFILKQILSGLEFLHGHGIIHRDLKPQNILMARRKNDYIPKITDFGISKKLEVNKSTLISNSIVGAGTLAYSSPEQLNAAEIRKNTDLWSFGVIAFQLLAGELPFNTGPHTTSEAGRLELFSQINSGKLPSLIEDIAEPWQTMIRMCLTKDIGKRVDSCHTCLAILSGEIVIPAKKAVEEKNPDAKQETDRTHPAPTNYKTKIEGAKPEEKKPEKPVKVKPKPAPKPKHKTSPTDRNKFWTIAVMTMAVCLLAATGTIWIFKRDTGDKSGNVGNGIVNSSESNTSKTGTSVVIPAGRTIAPQTKPPDNSANEQKERDRIEAERKEAEKKEAERKEAERKEVERLVAEKKEKERLAAEQKERERKAELKTTLDKANATFNSGKYSDAYTLYAKVKSLDANDLTGYNNYLTKAKSLLAIFGDCDSNAKQMLQYAKSLRNTQEVNRLLSNCKE